ncbi:MAG: PLDc N-terminal domain-containing protein [Arthrobacter sp.]
MSVDFLMWIPAVALLAMLVLTLTAGALISLFRTEETTGARRVLWFTVVLLVPVAGALGWLAVLQHNTRTATAADPETEPIG